MHKTKPTQIDVFLVFVSFFFLVFSCSKQKRRNRTFLISIVIQTESITTFYDLQPFFTLSLFIFQTLPFNPSLSALRTLYVFFFFFLQTWRGRLDSKMYSSFRDHIEWVSLFYRNVCFPESELCGSCVRVCVCVFREGWKIFTRRSQSVKPQTIIISVCLCRWEKNKRNFERWMGDARGHRKKLIFRQMIPALMVFSLSLRCCWLFLSIFPPVLPWRRYPVRCCTAQGKMWRRKCRRTLLSLSWIHST